jgi:hypothetical protein
MRVGKSIAVASGLSSRSSSQSHGAKASQRRSSSGRALIASRMAGRSGMGMVYTAARFRYMAVMSNHHRGRRTTVPPPAPVELPPPVTDPTRPAWVERSYAEIGYRLLEWREQFGLTPSELLAVMLRCGQDQLASLVNSERAGERRQGSGMGGSADLEAKREK